ncbi:DUF4431 domain-containing protein [Patescibacteria group bacterium]|nr:DUF4431 domain-containing protein [Patescibacteria group bacterium]
MSSQRSTFASKIKWNEVTWYSKLGAIIFFIGVAPALSFYIGMQYQAATQPFTPHISDLHKAAGVHRGEILVSDSTTVFTLSGKLVEEQFFGPPNYGESPQTDSKQNMLMLLLSKPVNVQGNETNFVNNEYYPNINKIQLELVGSPIVDALVGKEITVSGTFHDAHNAHQHTPVLLKVETITAGSK